MNKFDYELLEPAKLIRTDRPNGRIYVDSDGFEYHSVTTLLSKHPQKKHMLAEWRRRVGDAEANRVMAIASQRGTRIHDGMEKYLRGDVNWTNNISVVDLDAIMGIKKHVDANVDLIYGIELQLCSRELATAGTADLVCRWLGKNTIGDFKTSKRYKRKADITDYFLQSAAYGVMVKEKYDIDIEQIAIIMHVDHEKTLLFVENIKPYANAVKKLFPALAALK